MKCLNPDCGEEIPEEALSCPFCGTKKVAEIELSATDASMFEYEYDSESGGMVIKTYLGNSSMVIIPGELERTICASAASTIRFNKAKRLTSILPSLSVRSLS